MQARTLEFCQQLGLAQQLIERGIRIDSIPHSEGGRDIASRSWGDAGTDIIGSINTFASLGGCRRKTGHGIQECCGNASHRQT